MNKGYHRLSRQLSLGIMLLAAPIFILSLGILFVQLRYLIHQEASECSNSALNTSLHRVRYYMNTIETAINSNAWLLEENIRPDSLKSVSNHIVRQNPNVISSSVFAVPDMFREYGRKFSLYTENKGDTVETYCEPEYDYFDKVCYTKPVISGKACWVDPFVDYSEGKVDYQEAVATYCRPIRMDDGRIVGVVTADLSFSRMAKILNEAEPLCQHAYYVLLGSDGRYLIHPDSTRLFRKTIFTDADSSEEMDLITLGHEMTAGKQGTIHILSGGKRYHVCYRPVPGTDWSLALLCPDSETMKSFYRLGYVVITLLVIGLLLILLLCNHTGKQVISPIHQLIDITRKMEDGQFGEAVPVSPLDDTVGKLQNSFAKMQQSLNERMYSLRRQADEVRQRNGQQQQLNQQTEDAVENKTRFIKHVTQQMRMPLNVISGFADVMGHSITGESIVSEEELLNIKYMIKSNAINMNRMAMLLLDASETDANGVLTCSRNEEVSCNKIAKEVIEHVANRFPNSPVHFETEVDNSMQILTNRIFLLCVLIEPLYNAVSYSDGEHITLRVSQTATTIRFTIQDTGPGLPPEMPESVFMPFREIDNLQMGVGIGLPLARRHAIGLGGSLTIDTDYREGCRIVVEMPR